MLCGLRRTSPPGLLNKSYEPNNQQDVEAKELRIGGRFYSENVKREIEVSGFKRNYVWHDESGSSIDDINPIPISEEWLERFGFEADTEMEDEYNIELPSGVCTGAQLYCSPDIGAQVFIKPGEGYEFRWFQIGSEIKHVHQLQNLYFSLTAGKELTIKNNKK